MFNPLTGQFESRRIATLDPVVYNELKDSTTAVSEEAAFLREHASKNKQHLREIKARLRKLETATPELDIAMELDVIHAKLEELKLRVEEKSIPTTADTSHIEAQIIELQNRKSSNLVSVKIDQKIEAAMLDLGMALNDLRQLHDNNTQHQKNQIELLNKKLKLSIWLSVASTVVILALKLLL